MPVLAAGATPGWTRPDRMGGAIEVSHVSWRRPGGPALFDDVSFFVREGERAALVGANGVGKTTMLRLIAAEEPGYDGTIRVDGSLGFMHQLVGSVADGQTVRDLFVALAPDHLRRAAHEVSQAEAHLAGCATSERDRAGLRYAGALARWGELGGYEEEVGWDDCATRAVGADLEAIRARRLATFSGGEQKRLALEYLFRSSHEVLLLDEPDNFLDIPGKRWLEGRLRSTAKTVLFVSHDRALLAATSTRVVTLEGRGAWIHGASFATWHDAHQARLARLEDQHRQWADERKRLEVNLREMKRRAALNDANARRADAAETRLRHFDEAGPPPERPPDQRIAMRLSGGRTGKRVVIMEGLELTGMTFPFDAEVWFGERVGVVGVNGTGKSHLLRLLAGEPIDHGGGWCLGARVVPGHFAQTHDHPELRGRTVLDILAARDLTRGPAMARLRRYELDQCAEQSFETLSGGQQARLQILLLELGGATLLLLDEPTDNLDLVSADALQGAVASFEGTVMAVTHDRWLLRSFDRFLVFHADGDVTEEPVPDKSWA
jgi:ATPase subunit of ABC transporter with duplicated ATPase domains